MKKTYFWQTALMAGALLFGFTACSSDDNDAQQQNNNEERTLTIALNAGNIMRSTNFDSDPGTAKENAISSLTIALFDNNDNVVNITDFAATTAGDVKAWETSSAPASGTITVTVSTQGLQSGYKVMAVANTTAGKFSTATTLTQFKDIKNTIDEALDAGSDVEKDTNLPMLGVGTIKPSATTGIDFEADIKVYHMVAKVSIETLNRAFSGIYSAATFTVTDVYLKNVPSAQPFWYTPSTESVVGSDTKPYLGAGSSVDLTDNTKKLFFYTMPNNQTDDNATKIIIKGEFDPDGAGSATATTVYYPIYLDYVAPATPGVAGTAATGTLPGYTDFDGTTSIVTGGRTPKVVYPNDWYKISVTLKAVGTTDEDVDLDPQAVQVNVTAQDFTATTQSVTFGN